MGNSVSKGLLSPELYSLVQYI